MALSLFIVSAVLLVAYANGANANFKGVASLVGSGTLSYRAGVGLATTATAVGCLLAIPISGGMLGTFSGKGLVPPDLVGNPGFLLAVAAGAGLANLLATGLGFPVSTTHLLVGGLLGAGLAARPEGVDGTKLWQMFLRPLLLSPILAIGLGAILFLVLRRLRWVTDERNRTVDALHQVSGGAVCLSRGLNDTPKMAALLVGVAGLGAGASMLAIAALMAIGGLVSARRVAETLAHKITGMNPGQAFSANLATSLLTTTASFHGLPVSTTHVSVGALLGIGLCTRQVLWRTTIPVLLAWLITLPCAAVLSALLYKVTTFLR